MDSLRKGKILEILVIPRSTTGFVQPLDVFGFRFWNSFVRFFNLVILRDLVVNIHLRLID